MKEKKYIIGKYNPFELNKILFDDRTAFYRLIPKDFNENSFLWCYFAMLKSFVKPLIKFVFRTTSSLSIDKYKENYDNTILFFLPTINNQRSLNGVMSIVEKEKENVRLIKDGLNYNNCPRLRMLWESMKHLSSIRKTYQRCSHKEKRIFLYYKWDFIDAIGVIWFYNQMFEKYRPECVVLSNDHRYLTKSLELVCEDYGIKTIYVQHASVSHAFPELHFTYSFLDGMDSLLKYTDHEKQATGSVFLLGAARYDTLSIYRNSRDKSKRNCIGIAINPLDNNKIANDFCNRVLEHYPTCHIKIRTHPAMKESPFLFDNKDRIIYTCATDENIVDYLDSIDFQIGGDSGIHFDAMIGGVKSIAYNFSHEPYKDNYGYVRDSLLKYAGNLEQLYELIEKDIEINVSKIRFFDEAYGKEYSGHCSEIIADFIIKGYDKKKKKNHFGFVKIDSKNNYFVIPN